MRQKKIDVNYHFKTSLVLPRPLASMETGLALCELASLSASALAAIEGGLKGVAWGKRVWQSARNFCLTAEQLPSFPDSNTSSI